MFMVIEPYFITHPKKDYLISLIIVYYYFYYSYKIDFNIDLNKKEKVMFIYVHFLSNYQNYSIFKDSNNYGVTLFQNILFISILFL